MRRISGCGFGRWVARWAAIAAAALPVLAAAQTAVADFAAAPPSGAYAFPSRTPRTLPELLRGGGEPQSIIGHLDLPPGGADGGRVPAVVFMHGSGGLFDAMRGYWPRFFSRQGYAMLALDTFSPRGVRSTAEDQSQVPPAADVADVYAALRLLASHPRIDPDRIALIGTSRGGTATWRAALQRVIDSQPGSARYAAFLPMYSGGCAGSLRVAVQPGVFGPAPMLWLHGDADDYAPIEPCQDFAREIGAAGIPVTFLTLPGAGHKFDADSERRIIVRRAQAIRAGCPLEFDMTAFTHRDRRSGQTLSKDALSEVYRSECTTLGASIQGNHAARDTAAAKIVEFLRGVFGR
ncbi:MAG TPA: dienelactone hydrolase family protein [Burkholderiaceae bacterium]|nr:dienelactone hydrolase family protein [Burkholderiaceae bacterium]HMZ02610.1 dienelactone hydrolase family protein [Burkholderiaceae bacterium]HNG79464.1 dienelactone hydrolase family protein [Burkholderiaceae bacterium]